MLADAALKGCASAVVPSVDGSAGEGPGSSPAFSAPPIPLSSSSITTTALSTVFLATRRRSLGKDVFAVAFPLLEGVAFVVAVAFCLQTKPLVLCLRIIGGDRLPVPLPIYSIFSTMLPRANSPPGRLALRLDPRRGRALTQELGLADPRMTRATPHTNQFCMRLLRL